MALIDTCGSKYLVINLTGMYVTNPRNVGSLGILRNSIPDETFLMGGCGFLVYFLGFFKLKQIVFPRDTLWKLAHDHQNLTHDLIHAIGKGDSSLEVLSKGYEQ